MSTPGSTFVSGSERADGSYYFGEPGESTAIEVDGMVAVGKIWNLPIAITTAITRGTALVGSFKRAAFIGNREGLRIDMTNSDNQDFVYNRIAKNF